MVQANCDHFIVKLATLEKRVLPLSRIVEIVSAKIGQPRLVRSPTMRGFRFEDPQPFHFILLRCVRIVSLLNASLRLAEHGFVQEIGVLMRTLIEYSTQIDFVLSVVRSDGSLPEQANAFISDYFQDSVRPTPRGQKRAKLPQKTIHDTLAQTLDQHKDEGETRSSSDMMSNVYLICSNYVHGRYPEIMDLYGGQPGRFHLNGMSGTPKDNENYQILDCYLLTAELSFAHFIKVFQLQRHLNQDVVVASWLNDMLKG